MPKSQTRGEKLAMQTTKIVSSQPTSDGERTEASPTRKSNRGRANALQQSPVDTTSRKNNNVVGKQNEQPEERLRTPISTSSSSTLPLVRSGSSNTTQLPANKNAISNTPQGDISTYSSGKFVRENSVPGHHSSQSKNKLVLPKNDHGLSEEIEDDSSEDITDDMKRKKRSRAALDDSFDLSDEDNRKQTTPQLHRGLTNNSPAINENDNSRKRLTQSAKKNRTSPRKNGKTDYEDEYNNPTTSSSRSRASTPQADNNYARSHGKQNAHLPYHEAAIGKIALYFIATLATPCKK
jgi:hypothetical protein